MPEKEKEEVKEYKHVEVPTNFVPAIQTPDEKVLSVEQALVEILNKIDKIEKAVE
jgi:hypothetical protein